MRDTGKVLVVDEDVNFLSSLKYALRAEPYDVWTVDTFERALEIIEHNEISVLILDIPEVNGLDFIQRILEKRPNLPIIVISAFATSGMAIKAMDGGAYDFLTKPFDLEKIKTVIEDAIRTYNFSKKVGLPIEEPFPTEIEEDAIVGKSPAIIEISKLIGQVAKSNVPVLIQGETGTGKELVARAIHGYSRRSNRAVMAVNCAAIPETLLESELFGYEKGAFTGAYHTKPGKVERAHESTLFLDEIGDLSPALQAKILRFLETGEFERVGGTKSLKVDVRVISATNVDLKEAVKKGKFREDLYYRLNVVNIYTPPLRERKEDIPLLSNYILRKAARDNPFRRKTLSDDVIEKLMSYHWPGNVRELFNVLHRAIVLSKGRFITSKEIILDTEVDRAAIRPEGEKTLSGLIDKFLGKTDNPHKEVIEMVERTLVKKALEMAGGNKSEAARLLGISRNTLRERISYYKIKISSHVYHPSRLLKE